MQIIQQIVVQAVEEICKTIQITGLEDIGKVIKSLQPVTNNMVLEIVQSCIAEMDRSLVEAAKAQRRVDGITVKQRNVERTITTELGDLCYSRTYFTLADGSYSYLVDHLIGVESYERISRELVADILQASSEFSYEKAIRTRKQTISRQTVHNRLTGLRDITVPAERREESPETLDIFADEDHVHLKPKGKAIVPLVTITEGIDESNPRRHATIHPLHVAAYGMAADAFRENVLAVMTQRYELDKVKQINIHGDGGSWIQGLQQVIPRSRFVLDGYHLERELRSFLRLKGAGHYAGVIRQAMSREDGYEDIERYCGKILEGQETGEGQNKVRRFVEYCARHWEAIVIRMSRGTCGSCTESQVSHVLSERLSRNPIAWSKEGLNRMTMLVVYRENGGVVTGEDVRIRRDERSKTEFHEDGYARYRDYAIKQADEVLKGKYDWSIFEQEKEGHGKIDGIYLIRKSLGSIKPLARMIS